MHDEPGGEPRAKNRLWQQVILRQAPWSTRKRSPGTAGVTLDVLYRNLVLTAAR